MKVLLSGILILVLLFSSCKDAQIYPCHELRQGLLDADMEAVGPLIDDLLNDLHPAPTNDDNIGHAQNLTTFVDRLRNECTNFEVTIECYGCIETFPVLSEVVVSFDKGFMPTLHRRVLDIVTPSDSVMSLRGIHQ